MLLNTTRIRKIESRFLSLFERTFLKATKGKPAPAYSKSVRTQFKSKTFEVQADKIIDDIYLQSIDYTDSQVNEQLSASLRRERRKVKVSASTKPLPITEEAVKQAVGLSEEVTKSITRILKDDGIYLEHPDKLEQRVRDLWGGQKYRARRFTRTFVADVATNTELWRYQDSGIDDLQFYAKIDEKTSDQCRMLHGTIFRTNSPDARRYMPPCHFHCRSDIIPVPITMKVDPKMRYENRDFSRQMDQDFDFLEDRTDKDLIKKTFEDIDYFRDEYSIDQFILDEDLEARLQKLNVKVLSELPEEELGLKYTQAKTVKEAETWVLENTSVKYTDFKGVDIDIVNEMNERLSYHLNLAPKISEKMKFYGTGQAQFELWYQDEINKQIEWFRKLHPGEDDKQLLKRVKKLVKKPTTGGYAHTWNQPKFGGIGVNKKYGGDPLEFSKYLDTDVASGFHPIDCNTPKSTFDHEFGHVLDYVYKVSDSPTVLDLYDKLLKDQEFTKSISRYASTNRKELVAEAWAEYLNNPEPRAVSKQIGELIMSKIKEGQT
jgi:SPP1 gp7 family putative phage head morphogenesis protein